MLIAIGTSVDRLGRVTLSRSSVNNGARPEFIYMRRVAWQLVNLMDGRPVRGPIRMCVDGAHRSPRKLEETPKFRNVTLRVPRRACLLSHNAYHYANRRFAAAYTVYTVEINRVVALT